MRVVVVLVGSASSSVYVSVSCNKCCCFLYIVISVHYDRLATFVGRQDNNRFIFLKILQRLALSLIQFGPVVSLGVVE